MPTDLEFIDDPDRLAAALETVAADVIGVDVERADSHRYYRTPALIQVGVEGRCLLVDPLAIPDCGALDRFLHGRVTVLHALENDLIPLRSVSVDPANLADTAIAAALLGLPTGLTPLLETVLDVELGHDKAKFQRADWEQRPLGDGMAGYAADDVVYLPALWQDIDARLDAAGRRAWYEEELAATIAGADDDRRDWSRTKSAGKLNPQGRATLRELWQEREAVSQEHDIAPQRLLHDDDLVAISAKPPRDVAGLLRASGRRRRHVKAHAERLFAAVTRGLDGPPLERDPDRPRWTDEEREAFDAMRRTRAEIADGLGIEAGVLCPSRQLREAVSARPSTATSLGAAAGLRTWQRDLLEEPLWATYAEALAGTVDNAAG